MLNQQLLKMDIQNSRVLIKNPVSIKTDLNLMEMQSYKKY